MISGPLFLPQVDEKEGKTYVKYQVSKGSGVGVFLECYNKVS